MYVCPWWLRIGLATIPSHIYLPNTTPIRYLGRCLGIIGPNPCVSKSNRLFTCCDLLVFSWKMGVYSSYSSEVINSFSEVFNFNWLFLKFNRLICNESLILLIIDFGKYQNKCKWVNIWFNFLLWWHVFVPLVSVAHKNRFIKSHPIYFCASLVFFCWKPCPYIVSK